MSGITTQALAQESHFDKLANGQPFPLLGSRDSPHRTPTVAREFTSDANPAQETKPAVIKPHP